MKVTEAYTFDDVLLIPKYSEIEHRESIDTSVDFGKGVKLDVPLVSANMKTITETEMAICMARSGGMGILHRFSTVEKQIANYKEATDCESFAASGFSKDFNHRAFIQDTELLKSRVGISIGVTDHETSYKIIEETAAKIICIDVAHGHHKLALKTAELISSKYPDCLLIAGNVCTYLGARDLHEAGADVIKVGVGSGSLCSTRIEAAAGYPQLSALANIYEEQLPTPKFMIIADGGVRTSGDVIKSLCFSNAVMLGGMLSGSDATPGDIINFDGKCYKAYAGSSTHKTKNIEGVSGFVQYKGETKDIIRRIREGLTSGMSYQGCTNLTELRRNPEFVKLTGASQIESAPHAKLK